jgi:pantothenate synthetase
MIYNCLSYIKDNINTIPFELIQQSCIQKLAQNGFETEYILLVNADNLEILRNFDERKKMIVLIATFIEGVRLIDNLRMN